MDEEKNNQEVEQLKKLIEKNLKLTQEIYKMTKSIKQHVLWQKVFGLLKILIIVVPLILGIIYLPPLLKDLTKQYQDLLNISGGESGGVFDFLKGGFGAQDLLDKDIDINKLPPGAEKYLK